MFIFKSYAYKLNLIILFPLPQYICLFMRLVEGSEIQDGAQPIATQLERVWMFQTNRVVTVQLALIYNFNVN